MKIYNAKRKILIFFALLSAMFVPLIAQVQSSSLQNFEAQEKIENSPNQSARLQPFFFDHNKELARKHFIKGVGFYNAKNYAVAARYFLAALQKREADNDETLKLSTIRYFLGLSYFKAGYLDESLQQWSNIEKLANATHLADINDLQDKRNLLARLKNYEKSLQRLTEDIDIPIFSQSSPIVYNKATSFPQKTDLSAKTFFHNTHYELVTPIALALNPSPFVDSPFLYVMDISTYNIFTVNSIGIQEEKHSPRNIPFIYYPIKRPYDFSVASNGELWVTSLANNQLVHLSKDRSVLNRIGGTGVADGQFLNPRGVAIGPKGTIWVADSGNARLQVFSDTGEWIRTLGSKGTGNGEYLYPTRIVYEPKQERFYVLDVFNKRIQVLDVAGNPLYTWGSEDLLKPVDLKIVPGHPKTLLVLDSNALLIGDTERRIWKPVQLNEIKKHTYSYANAETSFKNDETIFTNQYLAVALDKMGTLYLANGTTGQIDVFQRQELHMANAHVEVEHVNALNFPIVRIDVKVRNVKGIPVEGLIENNFFVSEEGVEQEFSLRSMDDFKLPFRTTFLMEVTEDIQDRILLVQTFFDEFMKEISSEDRVFPIFYGNVDGIKNGTLLGENYLAETFSTAANVKVLGGGEFIGPGFRRVLGEQLTIALNANPPSSRHFLGKFAPLTENPINRRTSEIQQGFPEAIELGIEKLLPYSGKRALVLFALTPHALTAWSSPESPESYNYAQLLSFAIANHVPIYIVYGGKESLDARSLIPLKNFAEQSGGKLFSYEAITAGEVVMHMRELATGRYSLYYESHKRPLGKDLFFPVNVRAKLGIHTGQDSWNGFIHP